MLTKVLYRQHATNISATIYSNMQHISYYAPSMTALSQECMLNYAFMF